MRRLVQWSAVWTFLALFAWTTGPTTWAGALESEPHASPSVTATEPSSGDDPKLVMEQGLSQEREHNWAAAIESYRKALERWPSKIEFSRRLRLCELHFKLNRRYQDVSFRGILLQLPREQAIDLYSEVMDRIQTHYVDPVPFEPLIRHGLDNMEVALRDPLFLKTNAPAAAPERVTWLREQLRTMRSQLAVADRTAAIQAALAACDLAGRSLEMQPTPVLLEFTCGACDALDDFTSYLTPDKLEDLYAMIDGNFVGLGIELKNDPEGLRLVGVIRGGPAWEAGIVSGDRIVKVAGQSVKGLSLDEAANRLQGAEGTSVDLEVLRRDGDESRGAAGPSPCRCREHHQAPRWSTLPRASATYASRAFRRRRPKSSTRPSRAFRPWE